jgi:hypothetical protein
MQKSRSKKLPRFKSLDELVEFFDTHDMGEYWKEMPEAHFDVDIKKKAHFIAIDNEIANRLTQIAHVKKTSSQRLVNSWLREKILAYR